MIQPIRLQRRIPLLALLILALAALVSISPPRFTIGSAARPEMATPSSVATDAVQADRPQIVQAAVAKTGCDSGTYVSGDVAGDRSPAEIYAAMCGKP